MPEKGVNRREREVLFDHREMENTEQMFFLLTAEKWRAQSIWGI
jgi:hypothetical protein